MREHSIFAELMLNYQKITRWDEYGRLRNRADNGRAAPPPSGMDDGRGGIVRRAALPAVARLRIPGGVGRRRFRHPQSAPRAVVGESALQPDREPAGSLYAANRALAHDRQRRVRRSPGRLPSRESAALRRLRRHALPHHAGASHSARRGRRADAAVGVESVQDRNGRLDRRAQRARQRVPRLLRHAALPAGLPPRPSLMERRAADLRGVLLQAVGAAAAGRHGGLCVDALSARFPEAAEPPRAGRRRRNPRSGNRQRRDLQRTFGFAEAGSGGLCRAPSPLHRGRLRTALAQSASPRGRDTRITRRI